MSIDTKIKITYSIPIGRPGRNEVLYTKEALENAVNNLHANIPITCTSIDCPRKAIGFTTGNSHSFTWDHENQVCKLTVEGVIFFGGLEIIANKIEDNAIADFEIVGLGLTQ